MNLTLKTTIQPNPGLISYQDKIISLGSCFADNVGHRLQQNGFDAVVNPYGILFNPFSILNNLIGALQNQVNEEMFVERGGQWFHFNYHSELNATSREELSRKIEAAHVKVRNNLTAGKVLMLTFGTSWVFQHKPSGSIVANCHKVAQDEFQKTLLDLGILKTIYRQFFTEIFQINPTLKVILTVSPVRHSRNGLHENNSSKAILHLLADDLVNHFEQVCYFPAYEVVIDELRDYRFYKEDLVHPSDQAVSYVFDLFSKAYMTDLTQQKMNLIEKIRKAEAHQFMHPTEEDVRKHELVINRMKEELKLLLLH